MTASGNGSPASLRGVVAVGASAGGVEALTHFAGAARRPALRRHRGLCTCRRARRACWRRSSTAADRCPRMGPHGERAPAGNHLRRHPESPSVAGRDRLVLGQGPSENGHRPAINALFRSVALNWGSTRVGVLMSGVLDDGVLGLAAIRVAVEPPSSSSPRTPCSPTCPATHCKPASSTTEAAAADLGQVADELATDEPEDHLMNPTGAWSWRTASRMEPSFVHVFRGRRTRPAVGLYLPGLQRHADGGRRQQLPLPGWPCLDSGSPVAARTTRVEARPVDSNTQPGGKGEVGAQHGAASRSRQADRPPHRRGRPSRAGDGPVGQRISPSVVQRRREHRDG